MLGNFTWLDVETADRIGRLKELAVALATTLREHRNTVSVNEEAGSALARMMQEIAPAAHRGTRSGKFVDAALAIVNLLNELLATEFTLIADPEAYAPLAVFARWWQPSSYPAVVAEGLQEIVRKLVSAIRLRARLGQKSENLVLRLRQALGNTDATAFALNRIAETETGLAAGIDDWLRGRERGSFSHCGGGDVPVIEGLDADACRSDCPVVTSIVWMLGRVDGFDQDEAESKRDERAVILRRLLASKCDTLEAFELADRLFNACPCLVECFRKEGGHILGVGSIRDCRTYSALARGVAI